VAWGSPYTHLQAASLEEIKEIYYFLHHCINKNVYVLSPASNYATMSHKKLGL
jgi:hypothetical protein